MTETAEMCCPTCGGKLQDVTSWSLPDRTLIANGLAVRFTGTQARIFDAIWQSRGGHVTRAKILDAAYAEDVDGGPESLNIVSVVMTLIRKRLEPVGYTISTNMGNPRTGYRLMKLARSA